MTKLLLVCVPSGRRAPQLGPVLTKLAPDNLNSPRIFERWVDEELRVGALELPPGEAVRDALTVGAPEVPLGPVGTPIPEGSFAGVRWSAETIELVADAAGSRTLWYLETPECFAASTSQRALVLLSGRYEPNPEAMAWMLTSGTLGPGLAWDRRIRPVPPGGRVRFQRLTWSSTRQEAHLEFRPGDGDDRVHAGRLEQALNETMERLQLAEGWVLPLSGGFDSRSLLWTLRRRGPVPCLTWGTRASLSDPGSDAGVAQRVAAQAGVPFEFIEIDPGEAPAAKVLERFVIAGEARVDHLTGYLDGLALWERLRARGIRGLIRGDEGFGWLPAATPRKGRLTVGLAVLSDYGNAAALRGLGLMPGCAEPTWPRRLERRSRETVPTWRDRLYHQFRIPTTLAALHEVKTPFVELANPFLADRILAVVRQLPDHLRTEKRLFREVAQAQDAWGPYAERGANPTVRSIFEDEGLRRAMSAEVAIPSASGVLDRRWLDAVSRFLERGPGAPPRETPGEVKQWLRRALPLRVRQVVQDNLQREPLTDGALALRTFLILRMRRLLEEDLANLLASNR